MLAISLQDLAAKTQAQIIHASPEKIASGINSLLEADIGEISFLGNKAYEKQIAPSQALAIFVNSDFDTSAHPSTGFLQVEDASAAFSIAAAIFAPKLPEYPEGIHSEASIGENVKIANSAHIGANAIIAAGAHIGENTIICAGAYIGENAQIGSDCKIYPNTSILERCVIKDRCIIHSGTTIGSDGFGFIPGRDGHKKIPQIGIVHIESDVEIGANCSIDRARFGKTFIDIGTKIDNLVQIAHNVRIGKHCFLVAQTGIAGSTQLGDFVTMAGQTGAVGHIRIGDGATVTTRTAVTKNLAAGATVAGMPAIPIKEHVKERFNVHKVPKLEAKIKELEERLKALEP